MREIIGTQSPCSCSKPLVTHISTEDIQTHKGRSGSVCGVSGSCCEQGFVRALQASLVGMEFDSKCYFTPPTIILGLLLCLWKWSISLVGANILLLMCSATSCNFGVFAGDECTFFFSAILWSILIYTQTITSYTSSRKSRLVPHSNPAPALEKIPSPHTQLAPTWTLEENWKTLKTVGKH